MKKLRRSKSSEVSPFESAKNHETLSLSGRKEDKLKGNLHSMTIDYRITRSWKPTKFELVYCVFCQEASSSLGHNTISCPTPARNCRYCGIYGHLSIVCKIKKLQAFYNKVNKLKKNNSKKQKDLLHLH